MKAYEFKITLLDVENVWRNFVVPAGIKFKRLHDVIQEVMGWRNYHMYEFRFFEPELVITPAADFEDAATTKKADAVTIDKHVEKQRQFLYVYDFGDDWGHRVELLIVDNYPAVYPKVLSFEGNCPPEDCGGYPGYENFLEIIKDPKHEEYEELRAWAKEQGYGKYSLNKVNSYMRNALILKKIKFEQISYWQPTGKTERRGQNESV